MRQEIKKAKQRASRVRAWPLTIAYHFCFIIPLPRCAENLNFERIIEIIVFVAFPERREDNPLYSARL